MRWAGTMTMTVAALLVLLVLSLPWLAGACTAKTCTASDQSCFQVADPGPTQTCTYSSGNSGTCGSMMSGHCPSSGALGCCVTYVAMGSGESCLQTSATCYYEASAATVAMAKCGGADVGSMMSSWVTSVP